MCFDELDKQEKDRCGLSQVAFWPCHRRQIEEFPYRGEGESFWCASVWRVWPDYQMGRLVPYRFGCCSAVVLMLQNVFDESRGEGSRPPSCAFSCCQVSGEGVQVWQCLGLWFRLQKSSHTTQISKSTGANRTDL